MTPALKLFGGNILPEIRAEWVRIYRDMANLPNRGNLYFVGADVFKTDRITLVAPFWQIQSESASAIMNTAMWILSGSSKS